jgi:hypothetical protein
VTANQEPTTRREMSSGSAASKSTNDSSPFDPDFKAKEMRESEFDSAWFQKRYGKKENDKPLATANSPKSGGSGRQIPTEKSRVQTHYLFLPEWR